MDLETSSALVLPAEEMPFDPRTIPEAIRKAGFDAPEVGLKVRGRIQESGPRMLLRVPGLEKPFRLLGDEALEALRQKRSQWHREVLVVGALASGNKSQQPAIQVKSSEFPPP